MIEEPENKMSQTKTPFSRALGDVERVRDYLSSGNDEGGSRFRTIARDFPAMLQSQGLIVSLSFLYSKSKDEAKSRPNLDKGSGAKESNPKILHARYLELIVNYLDSQLPFQNREPLNVIRELVTDPQKLGNYESLLPSYVSELKMLSEATFKEEAAEDEK